MGIQVIAYVYISIAALCGLCFLFLFFKKEQYLKWFFLWMAITTVAFLGGNGLLFCIIVFCLLIVFGPSESNERVVYFLICLPVVPSALGVTLQLLGSKLFTLSYPRLLILCLLLPILFLPENKKEVCEHGITENEYRWTTRLVVIYVCYISLLAFREEALMHSLRIIILYIIDILIPYLAISRAVRSKKSFEDIFIALLFSSIILASIAIMSELKKWNFYGAIPSSMTFANSAVVEFADTRDSILRIAISLGPISLCYWLLLGTTALIYFYRTHVLSRLKSIIIFGLFSIVVFFTIARGGWLTFIVFFISYFCLRMAGPKKHTVQMVFVSILLFSVLVVFSFFNIVDVFKYDEYGTFEYRWRLIQSTLSLISLFGAPLASYMEGLEHMRQGQGIIDIVNTYIGIALEYGIVGFILFSGIFVASFFTLIKACNNLQVSSSSVVLIIRDILAAAIVAYAIMIGTISSVGIISYYGWLLAAVSTAFLNISHHERSNEGKMSFTGNF